MGKDGLFGSCEHGPLLQSRCQDIRGPRAWPAWGPACTGRLQGHGDDQGPGLAPAPGLHPEPAPEMEGLDPPPSTCKEDTKDGVGGERQRLSINSRGN